MKNRTEEEMMAAYQRIVNRMRAADLGLKKHILNNEASKTFKAKIKENKMGYKCDPPGNHQRNQAEQQSKPSRCTSSPFLPALKTNSHYHFGATCWN